jgi:hypothetical protein
MNSQTGRDNLKNFDRYGIQGSYSGFVILASQPVEDVPVRLL